MTTNQINYAKQREEKRHNAISEAQTEHANETARMNAYTNQQNAATRQAELIETTRANKAREAYNLSALSETSRANRAAEAERYRSNQANELIARDNQVIAQRHNVATENLEANRLSASNYNAAQDRVLASGRLSEDTRHNVVSEKLQDVSTASGLVHNITSGLASVLKFIA